MRFYPLHRITRLLLTAAFVTHAAAIAGDLRVLVKDGSGAAVPDAYVRVAPQAASAAVTKATGSDGVAAFPALPADSYEITVQHEGFSNAEAKAEVKAAGETLIQIQLKIAPQETGVEVEGDRSKLANSDPNYRALRDLALAQSYLVENIELKRDVGSFQFKKGTFSFAAPVLGRVVLAVFQGEGSFHLTPAMRLESDHLQLMTNRSELDDSFSNAVLVFTDSTYDELKASLKTTASAPKAQDALNNFRHRIRRRAEPPRSMTEYLLQGDEISNLDAEILNQLYNPEAAGSFRAYMSGHQYADLRFVSDRNGALPSLLTTEEIGLINMDPLGSKDGILYLTHYQSEWKSGLARRDEDRRSVAALNYKIETVMGKRDHLSSDATVRFNPVRGGDRILKFDLLPNLRVLRVTQNGKDIGFIQESRKLDGAFYAVFPSALEKGQPADIRVQYEGDKVVHNEGGGTFAVRARESWYPSLNAFRDRAAYDLTFKVPRQCTLVSVGKLLSRSREEDFAVTHWQSDVPLSVAGFNYGDFKLKQAKDSQTQYQIESYATAGLPDYLRAFQETQHIPGTMDPARMASDAIVDAENAIRCFTAWFGPLPYGRVAITQQPEFNFGQSWPTLIYLPIFSFLDSTQRYFFLGGNTFRFSDFIQEVTPHEVSHQWWGHLVGWNSYHDQWLSEGFADFSAGLFLQQTEKRPDKYLNYWERSRKQIIEKNNWGNAPNEAGPIWMGLRLDTYKTEGAYRRISYPKGGYVLHMLRYLMQDVKTGDQDFIAMVHDFTAQYALKNASTEDFVSVVDKHMKPQLDLEGNGSSAWFFRQFVFGTSIASYHLAYSLADRPGGRVLLSGNVTQTGVDDRFLMRIPIYVDLGGGPIKAANIRVVGGRPAEIKIELPSRPKKVLLNYYHDVLAKDVSVEAM